MASGSEQSVSDHGLSLAAEHHTELRQRTCVGVDGEQFRPVSLELVRDLGVGADVCVGGRNLQDEPASGRVLRDALAVQRLRGARVQGGGERKRGRKFEG